MALGKLDIIIAADTAQIRKDMSSAVGIMQSSTQQMASVAKNAATLIGGYFTFDLFKTQTQQTLDFADNLSKLSQKTGISTDALYSLNAAAKLSDVEFEDLSGSLSKFNKNIGEASEGSGDAKKAFDRLGISVKNQDGTLKNSFDIMGELADQFQDMPDGATKASTAMALFGKSGASLIPLLNGGRDSLREYLGVMDNETGKAAERFNDSITKMGLSTKSGLISVMKEALPFMDEISTEFENMASKGSFLSHNAEYIAGSFDILSATMQGSKEVLSSVSDTAGSIIGTFHGMADSTSDYDSSLKEANDTTEKTLTLFQFLAVDIKTASLSVTIVSNTVKAAINDFMNLGFEAEKSFLKMKSFVGAGSKEDDYRVAQLSSFIANRNMDSANLALTEAEIAQSIMDYQAKSSAQNWARENNIFSAFTEISKTEFKGASDTKKIIDTYESLEKTKDDAIKKAGGDVDKIAAINAKYQATAQKLNNSFSTSKADYGIVDDSAQKKAQDEAERLSKEWAQRNLDITKNISIAQQDELAKPYIVLSAKYDEDLAHFKGISGAKERLSAEYTANVERLNLDTIAKVQKADEEALKKTQQDKKEAIEHALKMQEEGFRIQSRYINLLDDETDRKVALAHLEANRNNASLKAQYESGAINEAHYKTALGYEEDLLKKTLEHYTTYGQVIDGVASGMESSFQSFFDYSSDGFMKFGDLAKNILNEVYNEIMRVAVVKPLVSGLTTSAFSFFGSTEPASSSASSSSLNYSTSSGGSLTNSYFQAYDGGMIPFASGGYTGDGGKYEPKGVVHGGEYVIPAWMVQKNKPLISNLENVRARGYAEGGSVGGNVGSGGNIKVEIKNESSQSLKVTSATQTYDSEGAILSIVIDGIQKNKMGLRDMLGNK